VPDPLPCCKTCWVTIFNNVISLQDDRLINGKDLKNQLVVKIPIDNQFFDSRLHVEVLQHYLSAQAYDYLNALKTQVGSVGNIQVFNTPEHLKPFGLLGKDGVIAFTTHSGSFDLQKLSGGHN
jgi:hypothetical protein